MQVFAQTSAIYSETAQISRILQEMSADVSEEIVKKSQKYVFFEKPRVSLVFLQISQLVRSISTVFAAMSRFLGTRA